MLCFQKAQVFSWFNSANCIVFGTWTCIVDIDDLADYEKIIYIFARYSMRIVIQSSILMDDGPIKSHIVDSILLKN